MEITPELLRQFFKGECSKQQERGIRQWLLRHPEVLEQYLTEESWKSFEHGPLEAAVSERMRKNIARKIKPPVSYKRWMIAAACFLTLFSLAALLIQRRPVLPAERSVAIATPPRRLIQNTSAVTKTIKLPDGSVVSLLPGSHLSFDSVFGARRDVELAGCASFAVAKDPARPFCVHARNINVTALGTVFTVDDRNKITKVRLHEGKIVVQKEPGAMKNMDPVFLTPGQELEFDNIHFSNKVGSFAEKETRKIKVVIPARERADPVILEFNNEPLITVLKELETKCRVKITADTTALKDIRFTGRYKSSAETVEQFLNTLAVLNQLKINKTKNGFLIQTDE